MKPSSLLALLSSIVLSGPAAAADQRLVDLDLQELMEIQLTNMGITGIHHTHRSGEWMVGYRLMYMGMDGNRDGTTSLSSSDVFGRGFPVSPTSMTTEMHMLHAMYGVSDELTVMLMLPYVRKSMDHVTMAGGSFTTRARGIGDIQLNGLYSLYRHEEHRLVGKLGLSFPSGRIDAIDDTPMGLQRLPYPMQLGAGSLGVPIGLTYLGQVEHWGWGGHGEAMIYTAENRFDYRVGHRYELTGWGSREVTDWSSASLRLLWKQSFDYDGADPALDPSVVATADPSLRAGERLDLLFGFNLYATEGRLAGHRLAIEAGLPVYQRLDGPQLEADWRLSVSWDLYF